jgi:hypothetical protein
MEVGSDEEAADEILQSAFQLRARSVMSALEPEPKAYARTIPRPIVVGVRPIEGIRSIVRPVVIGIAVGVAAIPPTITH